MTPDDVAALFTNADGRFRFARWGRPLAPVVFGVTDATIPTIKGAVEAVAGLAGVPVSDTDPELGVNLMIFFVRDWAELAATPDLDRLLPGLPDLLTRLQAADANQYRTFRFDADGAIKACFVFIRMDSGLSEMPAETLALAQAAQAILLWSDTAFAERSPLAVTEAGQTVLRPEIAQIIQSAYAPVLPATADDPAFALRLFARMGQAG